MKIIRSLLLASALLVPLASAVVMQPAQAATSSVREATPAATANLPAGCKYMILFATRWSVNANNISIKNSPDGTDEYGIAKTATFNADTPYMNGFVSCYNYAAGQYWIYGTDQAHPSETGWVGCHYLNVLDSSQTCPQYMAL
jgi:hypothetical protein